MTYRKGATKIAHSHMKNAIFCTKINWGFVNLFSPTCARLLTIVLLWAIIGNNRMLVK